MALLKSSAMTEAIKSIIITGQSLFILMNNLNQFVSVHQLTLFICLFLMNISSKLEKGMKVKIIGSKIHEYLFYFELAQLGELCNLVLKIEKLLIPQMKQSEKTFKSLSKQSPQNLCEFCKIAPNSKISQTRTVREIKII
ncbi:hypothetical protein BpHYR1_023080 [Brachionus plicatilis]|uniref:Uncharacterized protein n=1 Tax=Brachionus plicatilis TaxID=10195 RepID=A0A3M7QV92_BRAPC|nr:hypothetical protein BpHYR1_023080 [Brachionus plicatilis]